MRSSVLMTIVLILGFSFSVAAQTDQSEALDKAFQACTAEIEAGAKLDEKCVEKAVAACAAENPSTHGETACATRAFELLDKKLEKVFEALLAKSDSNERKALKAAQKKWIDFRNAEFKLIDELYTFEKGSMNVPFNAYARMRVVKTRVFELQHYMDE